MTHLRLVAGAKNLRLLPTLENLVALWCFRPNAADIDFISETPALRTLFIDTLRAKVAISRLGSLRSLSVLHLEACSHERSLDWLDAFPTLRGLGVVHFRNVHELGALTRQPHIRWLSVAGSMWSKMTVKSLAPIAELKDLEYLDLTSLRAEDASLEGLAALKQLKTLVIANVYPATEFARLAGRLPNCSCPWFSPYVPFPAMACTKCGEHTLVILTGKGEPTLCTACDATRLKRHVEHFERARDAS
jgi:hypothetical protein